MAYSDSFPAIRPSFQFSADAGRLDSRISYSRSTTGSFYGKDKHLSSDNLLLQSSDFDTTWTLTATNGTPTGGQVDPSGGSNGWTVTEDTANNWHRLVQGVNVATGSKTLVVYAKQNSGTRYLTLSLVGGANNWEGATFDLAGGSPVLASGSSSTFTSPSATQTASGNGYYKCVLNATGLPVEVKIHLSDVTSPSYTGYGSVQYTGDGTSSIDIAFASLSTTGATDYNATTTQIHREYAPTLQTAAINAPRFEHSASDSASEAIGQSRGLLIEGQATNYLAGSATIGGTYWGSIGATSHLNSAVAPDGTLTATKLVENSSGGTKYFYSNNFTPAASTTYTCSVYVKPNGRNYCLLYTNIGGANQSSMFDLVTGATSNLSGSGTNQATQCGNGWWRISMTVTTSSTLTHNFQILTATDATTINYTGNGYSGLLCWGAMLEQSSFPSSYIGTTSSAVTRASDSAAMDLTQAGFNGGAVSIVGEFAPVDASVGGSLRVLSLSDGSDTENIRTHMNNSRMYSVVRSGAANTAVGYNSNALNDGEAVKFGLAVDTNSLIASTSGFNSLGTTGAVLPDGATRLGIAQNNSGAQTLDSHWKSIRVYGEPLSLTNLQALTS